MNSIEQTLEERGARYGDFSTHAEITQRLKDIVFSCEPRPGWPPYICEALDMIMHKVGRIVNGDPLYADSWHDIAGYATLVGQIIAKDSAIYDIKQDATVPK